MQYMNSTVLGSPYTLKTCLFLPARSSSRVRLIDTRFPPSCSVNIDLFNGICYIGAYGMLSLLRFGKHGPISH